VSTFPTAVAEGRFRDAEDVAAREREREFVVCEVSDSERLRLSEDPGAAAAALPQPRAAPPTAACLDDDDDVPLLQLAA